MEYLVVLHVSSSDTSHSHSSSPFSLQESGKYEKNLRGLEEAYLINKPSKPFKLLIFLLNESVSKQLVIPI